MQEELARLTAQHAKLAGAQACRNLIARYCYFSNASRIGELLELWAEDPAVCLETPVGTYLGKAGVARCYLQDGIGDREDNPDKMKGRLIIHESSTIQVTVSEDAQTAEATWLSPGNAAYPDAEGVCHAYWWWRRHKAAFIVENGTWKFLKMTIVPVFKTRFEQSWLTSGPEDFSEEIRQSSADLPPAQEPWFFGQPYKEVL